MPPRLPDELLAATDKTIHDYALITPEESIIVALSGGKDSMLLCLALRELGYDYVPVTIDMGYESGWADRINDLAGTIGLSVTVVPARDPPPRPTNRSHADQTEPTNGRVDELADEAGHAQPVTRPLSARISELVHAGSVDTDEPPRQPLRADSPDEVEIIRPFFDLSEDLVSRTVTRLGIATEGSGCGHGMTAVSETPREMVHHRVLAGRGHSPFFALAERLVRHGVSDPNPRVAGGRGR